MRKIIQVNIAKEFEGAFTTASLYFLLFIVIVTFLHLCKVKR